MFECTILSLAQVAAASAVSSSGTALLVAVVCCCCFRRRRKGAKEDKEAGHGHLDVNDNDTCKQDHVSLEHHHLINRFFGRCYLPWGCL